MSRQGELNSYIARLQRRLQVRAFVRGAAILFGTALAVTVALVFLLNRLAFPASGVSSARMALLASLAAVAGFCLAWPIFRLTRARAVSAAEAVHPEMEQRLTTFHQREHAPGDAQDPFLELLAADTLARAEDAPPSSLAPGRWLFALGGAGLACLGVLVWMIAAGPGYMGYGASLLWTGTKPNAAPLYAISVTPGDAAVRRNADQLVTARVTGRRPGKVQIFGRYGSSTAWEPVAMQAAPESSAKGANDTKGASYQFLFAGIPQNIEYYVAAGPLVSPHYQVRVVDLPSVKQIRVTYHYPKWTGMKPVAEEHSGDLRAIEGTDAAIEVEMDRPLNDGQLALDGSHSIHLTGGEGNRYSGSIHMEKDGAYHFAAADRGQQVRLSEDYFIATDKASPPEVAIDHPGREYRASPIEEVKVGVKASDQFGLHNMHLHYSVNGGPDKDVSLLKAAGAKNADGSYTLRLEDFKLVPGDLVSLYATARDGHAEARTDISFIQADPFEREFSQSQQGGGGDGGGSGGNNQTEMSKREKELIAQTWKQNNEHSTNAKAATTAGQFLSDAQSKLRDEVMSLSARMGTRDLSSANEEFTGFEKDMQTASAAMAPSAEKLKGLQWKDALPLEQKALQALLRAEATFRKIQVAFGQQGGGGGGGNSAGRDLASLFDLELDTEKNQYETAQTASPAEQHEKDVEDALEKLDALAKQQEELAKAQPNPQEAFQQRWQQEMLRREAEQLQRQMEQLARNGQGSEKAQSGGQSGSQSGIQSGSKPSGSGSQAANSSSPGGASQGRGESGAANGSGGQAGSQAGDGAEVQNGSQASSRKGNRGQAAGQSAAGSSDQRIEQALSRLRQAGDVMKRGGDSQASADSARKAADRLREATDLLGGTQQQLASSKLDSLSREAGRLTEQERAQADRINQLAGQQRNPNAMDRDGMMARMRDRDRLAEERQQLSDGLSKLQKNLRDTARQMAPNQPGAAQKLRDALTEMDQSDLDNHVQRTADWLRRGINPNSNGTETEIAEGLGKLDQQLRQAQGAMGQGKPGPRSASPGDQTAALGQVARLRSQVEAMASASRVGDGRRPNGMSRGESQGSQKAGQRGDQTGRAGAQPGSGGRPAEPGQSSEQSGSGRQRDGGGRDSVAGNRAGQMGSGGNDRDGEVASRGGDIRRGGGGADGTAWGNINTGNNQYGQPGRPAMSDASANPADTERTYQQSMRDLSRLRQMVGGDPQTTKEVGELAKQMQRLDPSRFPGNPALEEQMHREVLSSVDRLELQLQRASNITDARTGRPYAVPAGYQDSVADYYRRLSKKP